jgi:hypothetical protein
MQLGDVQHLLRRGAQMTVRRRPLMHEHGHIWSIAPHAIEKRRERLAEKTARKMHDARIGAKKRRGQAERAGEVKRSLLLHESQSNAISVSPPGQALAHRIGMLGGRRHDHVTYSRGLEDIDDVTRDRPISDAVHRECSAGTLAIVASRSILRHDQPHEAHAQGTERLPLYSRASIYRFS